ncbi:MAG TPA: bacteriohemerythrin [bacterium]|nr:bacteriohemerythrin [bacterium]
MIFQWQPIYSVNVKEIDEQHKKMFNILNRLFSEKDFSAIFKTEIMKDLENYADYHFKTEEKYFDKFGYAKSDEHKEMHQDYIDAINSFRQDGFTENQLKDFLQNWWIDHVQGADQEYSVFFNKNGLF